MYDEVKVFLKAVDKRMFLGGKQPNLADLVMFYNNYIHSVEYNNDGKISLKGKGIVKKVMCLHLIGSCV